MQLDAAKKWYAAAALASVVVLVAGWLLLVSPQRATADDIAAQADSQLASNQVSQAKIDALKLQYQNLPSLQAELAVVGSHIPQAANLPSLLRTLSQAAVTAGVTLSTVTPSNPVPLTGTSSGGPGGLAAPGGVNVIPVVLQITGPFANTRLFLASLEGMPRSFLVTGLTVARGTAGASATGTPAPGSLSSTITGRVFAANPGLPAVATVTTPTVPTTTG